MSSQAVERAMREGLRALSIRKIVLTYQQTVKLAFRFQGCTESMCKCNCRNSAHTFLQDGKQKRTGSGCRSIAHANTYTVSIRLYVPTREMRVTKMTSVEACECDGARSERDKLTTDLRALLWMREGQLSS